MSRQQYYNSTGDAPELGQDWEPDTHIDDATEGWESKRVPYGNPTRQNPPQRVAPNTSKPPMTKDQNVIIAVVLGVVVLGAVIMLNKK